MNQNVITRNNVQVTGKGTQPLLFAHGFGCDQHMWLHLRDVTFVGTPSAA